MEKGSRGKRLACFSPSLSSASPFLVRACVSRSLPCTARRLFLLFLSFRFLALAMTGQFVPAAPHQPTHLVSSHTCTLRCPERTCSSSSSSSASLASARRVSSSASSFAAPPPPPPLALHCTCLPPSPRPTVTCPSRRTTSSARPTCPPSASTLFVPPHPFLPPCLPPPTLTHTPLQTENEDAHHRGPPRQAPDRLHSPCIHTPHTAAAPSLDTHGHEHSGTRQDRSGSTR